MSVTVTEKMESRANQRGLMNQARLLLNASGSEDEDDVEAAVVSFLGTEFPTGYRDWFLDGFEYQHLGGGVWEVAVVYRDLGNDTTFTFDTTGGTAHITQSLQTINRYAPAGLTAPDFKGAIGVTRDNVDGVDIVIPAPRWTESYFFLPSVVTDSYKQSLEDLTGQVNDDAWRHRAVGEVLFEGARGSRRGYGPWEITFQFAVQKSRTGLTVGDITGIDKEGWHYLWVRYFEYPDTSANMIVKRPVATIVDRVYDYADFTDLGIGS